MSLDSYSVVLLQLNKVLERETELYRWLYRFDEEHVHAQVLVLLSINEDIIRLRELINTLQSA